MTRSICLIDDDELFRRNLAEELRALGQPVEEAGDAERGLRLLESQAFETSVVDVLMPDVDGIELIARIRSRWPAMRVIAISGGGRLSADLCIDLARLTGADACVRKPLSARDILARISAGPPDASVQT